MLAIACSSHLAFFLHQKWKYQYHLKIIEYIFFKFPDLWISQFVYGTFTLAIYCIDFALILVKLPICTYPQPPVVQESNNAFVVWQVTTRWRCCHLKRKNVFCLPPGKLFLRYFYSL